MVFPLLLAAAGASAVGSIAGGLIQGNAAKKAAKIQAGSAQAALQAREQGYNRARELYAPGVAAYHTGMNALTNRLGLPRQAMQTAFAEAQPKTNPGAQAILAARPDVMAEYQSLSPRNMTGNLGVSPTPDGYADWWWNQYGRFEKNPMGPGAAPPAAQPAPMNYLTGY